jgi:two-component system KDP operon response regulator KdpE
MVADADPGIRRLLRRHFGAEGCVVLTAETGREALHLMRRTQLDLAIVSTDLGDIDGVRLIQRVRGLCSAPIIALMRLGGTLTPKRILDCGADDWIDEPFLLKELMARSRRLLQRAGGWRESDLLIAGLGSIEVDLLERRVRVGGKLVALTRKEFDLLALLVAAKGATLTHDEIVQQVWGRGYSGARQNLRRTISILRRKIEPDAASPVHLLSVRGSGYRLSARPG